MPRKKQKPPGIWRCRICSASGEDLDPMRAWTRHYMGEHWSA